MLEDLKKNVVTQLSERMTSPLSGSFVISWGLWNYKFLVILFSNNTVTGTFLLIKNIAFPTIWATLTNGILFPLLTALAYVFLYPYPSKFVYKFTRERQREISIIRQKIEDETPLTTVESRKLRRQHRQLQEDHAKELEKQEALVRDLKLELAGKSEESAPANQARVPEVESPPLGESELSILSTLANSNLGTPKELIENSQRTRVATEFLLGELAQKGFIQVRGVGESARYKLTHEGRRVLVDRGLDLR